MTNEILKEAVEKAQNKTINLGTANGWGDKTNALYKALKEVAIPESGSSENLGRCYNRYSFNVTINEEVYSVTYTVDSSD